jgi:hypothetical protein
MKAEQPLSDELPGDVGHKAFRHIDPGAPVFTAEREKNNPVSRVKCQLARHGLKDCVAPEQHARPPPI